MLETFRFDTFEAGDIFKVWYEDNNYLEILLVRINISKYDYPNTDRKAFSLIFTSDKNVWMEPGSYHMEQEKIGLFDVGLSPVVPLQRDTQFNYYEAAFT